MLQPNTIDERGSHPILWLRTFLRKVLFVRYTLNTVSLYVSRRDFTSMT